jgi:hypothetical protein
MARVRFCKAAEYDHRAREGGGHETGSQRSPVAVSAPISAPPPSTMGAPYHARRARPTSPSGCCATPAASANRIKDPNATPRHAPAVRDVPPRLTSSRTIRSMARRRGRALPNCCRLRVSDVMAASRPTCERKTESRAKWGRGSHARTRAPIGGTSLGRCALSGSAADVHTRRISIRIARRCYWPSNA